MNKKPIILCFVTNFLPGFKSGGPVKSLFNIIENFKKDFVFKVITADRDKNEKKPYSSIKVNSWNNQKGIKVFYLSNVFKGFTIYKLLKYNEYKLIYLNSFFSFFYSILPIFFFKLFIKKKINIIIAPRGELSNEALKIKKYKKKLFLLIVTFFSFYKNIKWHASSTHEKKQIIKLKLGNNKHIKIAPDLTTKIKKKINIKLKKRKLISNGNKMIFLSRINPMKNLDFLLNRLKNIKSKFFLDIYGPIDDKVYWERCKTLIKGLPANIKVSYKGAIHSSRVNKIIMKYSFFILPTRGESFGHVIYESLAAGTPVIISNKTPWSHKQSNFLNIISLTNIKKWENQLEAKSRYSKQKIVNISESAYKFIKTYSRDKKFSLQNKKLFEFYLN